MNRVQLLTTPECTHCGEVRGLLRRFQAERTDVEVEEIDARSPLGLRLSIEHGVLVMPGIIVNGRFLAMGSLNETLLCRELARSVGEVR
ncbi:MAG: thioredoxin family protein [bacterium]